MDELTDSACDVHYEGMKTRSSSLGKRSFCQDDEKDEFRLTPNSETKCKEVVDKTEKLLSNESQPIKKHIASEVPARSKRLSFIKADRRVQKFIKTFNDWETCDAISTSAENPDDISASVSDSVSSSSALAAKCLLEKSASVSALDKSAVVSDKPEVVKSAGADNPCTGKEQKGLLKRNYLIKPKRQSQRIKHKLDMKKMYRPLPRVKKLCSAFTQCNFGTLDPLIAPAATNKAGVLKVDSSIQCTIEGVPYAEFPIEVKRPPTHHHHHELKRDASAQCSIFTAVQCSIISDRPSIITGNSPMVRSSDYLSDEQLRQLTGLSRQIFDNLLIQLSKRIRFVCKLSMNECLVLVLMRLKTDMDIEQLSALFCISVKVVEYVIGCFVANIFALTKIFPQSIGLICARILVGIGSKNLRKSDRISVDVIQKAEIPRVIITHSPKTLIKTVIAPVRTKPIIRTNVISPLSTSNATKVHSRLLTSATATKPHLSLLSGTTTIKPGFSALSARTVTNTHFTRLSTASVTMPDICPLATSSANKPDFNPLGTTTATKPHFSSLNTTSTTMPNLSPLGTSTATYPNHPCLVYQANPTCVKKEVFDVVDRFSFDSNISSDVIQDNIADRDDDYHVESGTDSFPEQHEPTSSIDAASKDGTLDLFSQFVLEKIKEEPLDTEQDENKSEFSQFVLDKIKEEPLDMEQDQIKSVSSQLVLEKTEEEPLDMEQDHIKSVSSKLVLEKIKEEPLDMEQDQIKSELRDNTLKLEFEGAPVYLKSKALS